MRHFALGIGSLALLVSGAFAQNNQPLSVSTAYGPDSTIPLLIEFKEAQTQPTAINCSLHLATEAKPEQKDFYKDVNCDGSVERISEAKYRTKVVVPKGVASGKYNLTNISISVGSARAEYNGQALPSYSVTIENPEHIKFSSIKSVQ
jgi:hypothetical protein